ncbi:MAG: DUF4177 domain-containing protein [Chloroflexi bacterium]|nr:DUF4177 domain-containing protein [Chloroflexota bacterium]
MFEYQFVRVELRFFSGNPEWDYHEIIEKYALDGWRLVQIFAPGTGIYGSARYFEIIFERESQREKTAVEPLFIPDKATR